MSSSSSPGHHSLMSAGDRSYSLMDSVHDKEQEAINEAQFAADIGTKMRVPKRITLTGVEDDIFASNSTNIGFNKAASFASEHDPILRKMMMVPDRILVDGQEGHIETKGPPRELQLERAVMPPEADLVRVQTPPRVLRLDEYKFPAADDPPLPPAASQAPAYYSLDHNLANSVPRRDSAHLHNANGSLLNDSSFEPYGNSANQTQHPSHISNPNDVHVLRRQINHLNRRVMNLEIENHQRQQKDLFLTMLALAYAVSVAVNWLRK